MEEMEIYLVDLSTADTIRFPMLPESINVESSTRFSSYDIMNIGEIKTPLGEELTRFSWDGILPGESRKKERYIKMWSNPKGIQEKLSHFRNAGSRLHLFIPGTPIDHKVYLESYSVKYSGGMGDYNYTVNFVQLKDLKMSTEPPPSPPPLFPAAAGNAGTSGKAGARSRAVSTYKRQTPYITTGKGIEPAQTNRPPKKKSGWYVIQKGDSLWKIAQSQLGSGSRYTELAKLNGINSSQSIVPGQMLQLPNV